MARTPGRLNRDLVIGCTLLATALLLWAGNVSATRAAMLESVPPLAFNFWRWSLALAVFLPFTANRVWRQREVFRAHWRFFAVFSGVSITAFNSLYYVGLQYTTAVQGSLGSAGSAPTRARMARSAPKRVRSLQPQGGLALSGALGLW